MSNWLSKAGITDTQWPYFQFWLIALVIAEGGMLAFNQNLFEIYLAIAAAFLIGFLLRVLHLYPGQSEPLILDGSAVVLAIVYAFSAQTLHDSPWRFLLILCSSVIILPHFVFIAKEK